jgi:hypothetical protein
MYKLIQRIFKYLIIILLNMVVLTILLALWTDNLELWLQPYRRPIEFLKILGLAALTLVVVGCYFLYRRKRAMRNSIKIKRTILLTVLLSSPLYLIYTERILSNVLINGEFRNQLAARIHPCTELANGMQAAGLTAKEYQLIASSRGLPEVPSTACNIAFKYAYDGFLPDYSLELTYDMPLLPRVTGFKENKDRWSRSQSVRVLGATQRVMLTENRQ